MVQKILRLKNKLPAEEAYLVGDLPKTIAARHERKNFVSQLKDSKMTESSDIDSESSSAGCMDE